MTHPDLHRKVMYNGMICTIIGVTYSHPEYRGDKPFYSYHLMPEGKHSLKDSIQYQTVDKLAFEPPMSNLSELVDRRESVMSEGESTCDASQWDDQLGTVSTAQYPAKLELVK